MAIRPIIFFLHESHTCFSSLKYEVPFINKDGGFFLERKQNSVFSFYQHTPSSYTRNADYGSGGLNSSMHGSFIGVRGPFTPAKWIELEHQALIDKYIIANVLHLPIYSSLLRSPSPFQPTSLTVGHNVQIHHRVAAISSFSLILFMSNT